MSPTVLDPRTPVIVGTSQVIQRPGDWSVPREARGPIELIVEAARAAATDAASARLLRQIDWIAVVGGFWKYRNPAEIIAAQLGSDQARTALTAISGSAPQDAIGLAAERIIAGDLDVALVTGGEARWSEGRLRKLGETPSWITGDGQQEPEQVSGFPAEMIDEARELGAPAVAYALFDDSRRIAHGDSMSAHRDRIAELWSRFNDVAVGNDFAWDREPKTADAIREPSPSNRMVAFPYTKDMVANNTVDMASATLICSVSAARAAGVPPDRFVFPLVSAHGHETWRIVNRNHLHTAPALARIGAAAYRHAGITSDQLTDVDLYACFPAIVRMSTEALGIDESRSLTMTGGLGFAGAPIANSSGQSVAAMVTRMRSGGCGLIHANGGNATKHAVGIYSSSPPLQPFRRFDVIDDAMDDTRAAADANEVGVGEVEAATVAYDRDGPTMVVAAVLNPAGHRALVKSTRPEAMAEALTNGLGGARWHDVST